MRNGKNVLLSAIVYAATSFAVFGLGLDAANAGSSGYESLQTEKRRIHSDAGYDARSSGCSSVGLATADASPSNNQSLQTQGRYGDSDFSLRRELVAQLGIRGGVPDSAETTKQRVVGRVYTLVSVRHPATTSERMGNRESACVEQAAISTATAVRGHSALPVYASGSAYAGWRLGGGVFTSPDQTLPFATVHQRTLYAGLPVCHVFRIRALGLDDYFRNPGRTKADRRGHYRGSATRTPSPASDGLDVRVLRSYSKTTTGTRLLSYAGTGDNAESDNHTSVGLDLRHSPLAEEAHPTLAPQDGRDKAESPASTRNDLGSHLRTGAATTKTPGDVENRGCDPDLSCCDAIRICIGKWDDTEETTEADPGGNESVASAIHYRSDVGLGTNRRRGAASIATTSQPHFRICSVSPGSDAVWIRCDKPARSDDTPFHSRKSDRLYAVLSVGVRPVWLVELQRNKAKRPKASDPLRGLVSASGLSNKRRRFRISKTIHRS